MSRNHRIFVYGSLREGFFNYDKYLKGKVLKAENAKVKGIVYHMPYKGYPALFDGEDFVQGEVMELMDYDATIKALDKMEGFISEGNSKNEYHKKLVEVELEDLTKELCYVYYYNVNNDEKFNDESILIKHGDWKNFMLN
ncbi:MAG: gamma-glutamylcyclotransferase family protein [Clostridium sp.]